MFCWGMLEWFIDRGGSINSYGIACSIAIPPLAVGRSYFIFVRGDWFFFQIVPCYELMQVVRKPSSFGFGPFWREAMSFYLGGFGPFWREARSFYLGGFGPFWRVQSYAIHCT